MFLNMYCPINELGYGVFSRGVLQGLRELSYTDYSLLPIGQIADVPDKNLILESLNRNPWRRSAPSLSIWHEFDLSRFSGSRLVALPFFETNKLSALGKYHLSQMDCVLVTSTWAKGVLDDELGGRVPVTVVPGGVTIPACNPTVSKSTSSFVFLNVGKYETRKSTLETIVAYCRAFGESTADTRLICHCYNPLMRNFASIISSDLKKAGLKIESTSSESSLIATFKNAIVQIPLGFISHLQLSDLYQHCHIGVFPFKGEGWCLPLLEAITSGLPCIATNYSAPKDFLTPAYYSSQDLLLNNYKLQTAMDGVYFKGDRGEWATVNLDELIEKFKYCYNNYTAIQDSFNNSKIIRDYTWSNCASSIVKSME